jgi:hypothetical protein
MSLACASRRQASLLGAIADPVRKVPCPCGRNGLWRHRHAAPDSAHADSDPARKVLGWHASLKDLFISDVGPMSAAGIAFMLGMAVFFVRFFIRHMHKNEERGPRSRAHRVKA